MKTLNVRWTKAILFGSAMFMLPGCDKSSEPIGKGQAEFQITDSPTDDASVKSVFVTVADLKVDGKSISGFTKQTIDLKAYQAGSTKLLGITQLDAKGYSNVTLVLDADTDASGNAPGCYIQTDDDAKYKLRSSGTIDVAINKAWTVVANSKSTVVVDFDLRKSIRAMAEPAVRYNFVSDANLQASLRLVSQDKSGAINGSYSEEFGSNADKIIVFAYTKGSYNASTETQAQGDDAIFFKNAVTSAEISGTLSQNFKLVFLEAGDYELHFAAYNRDMGSNQFVFQNMLRSQTTANGSLGDFVSVQSGITVSISSVITGTL